MPHTRGDDTSQQLEKAWETMREVEEELREIAGHVYMRVGTGISLSRKILILANKLESGHYKEKKDE